MRRAGLDPRKQNVINYRGRADRLVLGESRFVMFVEFKLPGRELTPIQLVEKTLLESMGFDFVVVDSVEVCEELVVDEYEQHLAREQEKSYGS